MSQASAFGRLFVCACLLAVFARPLVTHGAEPEEGAGAANPSPDLAVFPWGDPQFTDGSLNCRPRPAWVLAACMDGGLWITNDAWYGWQPGLGDWQPELATNRLLIHLNRALMTGNLWIAVAGAAEPDAVLLAGFYDNELLAVSDPITLHVVAATPWPAVNTVEWFTNVLHLSHLPSASVISLSATNGMLRIFRSVLCQETPASSSPGGASSREPCSSSLPPGGAGARKPCSIRHVNATTGSDSYDGTAAIRVPSTSTGPKRTIAAALADAAPGDTVCVAAGVYNERVRFDGIRLIANGRVVLQYGTNVMCAGWSTLFSANDPRSALTWDGRFKDVPNRTTLWQFYSTGEEILRDSDGDVPAFIHLSNYWKWWGYNSDSVLDKERVWVYNEMTKGTLGLASYFVDYHDQAGWAFNTAWYTNGVVMTPTAAALLATTNLIATNFFKPFDSTDSNEGHPKVPNWNNGNDWLYRANGDTGVIARLPLMPFGNTNMALIKNHAKIMAESVPPLSGAAGFFPLVVLKDTVPNRRFDLNDVPYNNAALWPTSRPTKGDAQQTRWLHGDYKDPAYLYNHAIYDKITGLAN